MELTAGLPYFLINNGLLYQYPRLEQDKQAHVAIIGGGISGALTAYHLTEAGWPCILLDARHIGLGSTCASTSLIQYELDIPLHKLKTMKGDKAANRIYQITANGVGQLLSLMKKINFNGYEECRSLFFSQRAREKKMMEQEYNARKNAGLEVNWVDRRELEKSFGLNAYSGILSRQAAGIDTYRLTHHLLQHAMKKGLQVYDHSRVAAINQQKDQVALVMENKHRVHSQFVVNATGYEVVNFLKKGIVNFDCTYALASERIPANKLPGNADTLLWNTEDPYLYMRRTPDNRLLAGGRDEPFSNKVTRQLFLERKRKLLERDIHKAMPALDFKTEFTWSGTFGKTRDALPYIGPLHSGGRIVYALGFGGNGITFSQVAAVFLRDYIGGKQNRDAALFSFGRSNYKG